LNTRFSPGEIKHKFNRTPTPLGSPNLKVPAEPSWISALRNHEAPLFGYKSPEVPCPIKNAVVLHQESLRREPIARFFGLKFGD